MNADLARFKDEIEAAIDPARHTFEWIASLVEAGEARVFCANDAIIVADIITYPTGAKDVHGLVAAGTLSDIVEMLIPMAEVWGREEGCIGALIESRFGWGRALAPHGYVPHQLVVGKDL